MGPQTSTGGLRGPKASPSSREGASTRSALTLPNPQKLAALVPLLRVHFVRYASCLTPHSMLPEALIPTPRQQGMGGAEAKTGTPSHASAQWHKTRASRGSLSDVLRQGQIPYPRQNATRLQPLGMFETLDGERCLSTSYIYCA
jgi:hypothetical protein